MAIWSIIAAPLFMSNDLRNIKSEFKNILLNKEVIDVNQDRLAQPGLRVFHNHTIDIWLRPILPQEKQRTQSLTSFALAFVNRLSVGPIRIGVRLNELGLTQKYSFRDLFEKIDLGSFDRSDRLELSVPLHWSQTIESNSSDKQMISF